MTIKDKINNLRVKAIQQIPKDKMKDEENMYTIMHCDSFGMDGISHTDITTHKDKNGNSIYHKTTWYIDGRVLSETTTYSDGHSETEAKNLIQRCGLAVDPNISDEEFAKLKEKMCGIIADEVLDDE